MHLSSVSIGKNQKVAAGQPIGMSGGLKGNKNSGSSTGAHLHYEVRFKDRPIHPYSTKKPLSELDLVMINLFGKYGVIY